MRLLAAKLRCTWCGKPMAWYQLGRSRCRDCRWTHDKVTGHPPYPPNSRRTLPRDHLRDPIMYWLLER